MPFPISIVGVVVIGAVGGGATAAIVANQHSNYSDHTRYSDAEARRAKEREIREKKRREDLQQAKKEMEETLGHVRTVMADKAGSQGSVVFRNWNISAEDFPYEDFAREYAALDEQARKKIASATSRVFDKEEQARQQELDELNALLRRIAETRLGDK